MGREREEEKEEEAEEEGWRWWWKRRDSHKDWVVHHVSGHHFKIRSWLSGDGMIDVFRCDPCACTSLHI
uniref:Uncharacterized protein n=1 Tax=Knipowitschia caucasica TaxID=637954 RepID=A0AAV2JF09_KNICA